MASSPPSPHENETSLKGDSSKTSEQISIPQKSQDPQVIRLSPTPTKDYSISEQKATVKTLSGRKKRTNARENPDPENYYDTAGWGRVNLHTAKCDKCNMTCNKGDQNPIKASFSTTEFICWNCEKGSNAAGHNILEKHDKTDQDAIEWWADPNKGGNLDFVRAHTGYNGMLTNSGAHEDEDSARVDRKLLLLSKKRAAPASARDDDLSDTDEEHFRIAPPPRKRQTFYKEQHSRQNRVRNIKHEQHRNYQPRHGAGVQSANGYDDVRLSAEEFRASDRDLSHRISSDVRQVITNWTYGGRTDPQSLLDMLFKTHGQWQRKVELREANLGLRSDATQESSFGDSHHIRLVDGREPSRDTYYQPYHDNQAFNRIDGHPRDQLDQDAPKLLAGSGTHRSPVRWEPRRAVGHVPVGTQLQDHPASDYPAYPSFGEDQDHSDLRTPREEMLMGHSGHGSFSSALYAPSPPTGYGAHTGQMAYGGNNNYDAIPMAANRHQQISAAQSGTPRSQNVWQASSDGPEHHHGPKHHHSRKGPQFSWPQAQTLQAPRTSSGYSGRGLPSSTREPAWPSTRVPTGHHQSVSSPAFQRPRPLAPPMAPPPHPQQRAPSSFQTARQSDQGQHRAFSTLRNSGDQHGYESSEYGEYP